MITKKSGVLTLLFLITVSCAATKVRCGLGLPESKQIANRVFIERLVKASILDKKTSNFTLKVRAASVRALLSKIETKETPQWLKTLQEFALHNCYAPVSNALYPLSKTKNSYKPRDETAKKTAYEWGKKSIPVITEKIIELLPKNVVTQFTKNKTPLTIDGKNFNLSVECTKVDDATSPGSFIKITIKQPTKQNKSSTIGSIKFSCYWLANHSLLSSHIIWLSVTQNYGQQGWGKILVESAINLIRHLQTAASYKNAKIDLRACPPSSQQNMLPKLINWYKAFGFIPEKDSKEKLVLYLNKLGKVLNKYELINF